MKRSRGSVKTSQEWGKEEEKGYNSSSRYMFAHTNVSAYNSRLSSTSSRDSLTQLVLTLAIKCTTCVGVDRGEALVPLHLHSPNLSLLFNTSLECQQSEEILSFSVPPSPSKANCILRICMPNLQQGQKVHLQIADRLRDTLYIRRYNSLFVILYHCFMFN